MTNRMKILAIIDPQNDFIDGSLSVSYAKWEPACEFIKSLLEKGYDKVVMTKDWHPADHCSFAPQGGPWPAHCVAGTPGAEPFWMLKNVADATILKGQDPQKEEYGVDLLADVEDDKVEIDIVGLCYDYCVANCAKMTSEAHPNAKVRVLAQGCVAINPTAIPDFGTATVVE